MSFIIFWVTVTCTSDLALIIIVSGAYLLFFFEIGIPNFVCECILGWWSVLYQLWVTVTLTSDLVFLEKLCPEQISYIIKGRNPKFGVWMQLLMAECHLPFWVTLTLTSDLVCRIIVSRTYL